MESRQNSSQDEPPKKTYSKPVIRFYGSLSALIDGMTPADAPPHPVVPNWPGAYDINESA